MEDWQNRVIQEEIELREKMCKLYHFLLQRKLDNISNKFERREDDILYKQLNAMEDYHTILCERIKRF